MPPEVIIELHRSSSIILPASFKIHNSAWKLGQRDKKKNTQSLHLYCSHPVLFLFLFPVPIEGFSLFVDMPGLLLWSDIRQGFFLAQFVLFLIVFIGEHCADDNERNTWKAYATPIISTGLACGALLLFDLSERGRQLMDPFLQRVVQRHRSPLGRDSYLHRHAGRCS